MIHVLTIDLEEYFHSTSFTEVLRREEWPRMPSRVEWATRKVLGLLSAHHIKATFFVLGYVAKYHPELIREIHNAGHEIACHGFMHQPIYEQARPAFKEDVHAAKRLIEDITGERVIGYRAPCYSITSRSLWAIEVLRDIEFEYDSSIFPIHHDKYGMPGTPRTPYPLPGLSGKLLYEFPIATVRLCGINLPLGGGYLRIGPYRYTRWGIKHFEATEGRPAVLYFHPWELDPKQPRIPCGWRSRFRHYTGLETMEDRITQLLSDFHFMPLRNYYERIKAYPNETGATCAGVS